MGLWNTHAERTGVALAGGAVLLVGGSVAASSLLAGYPVLGGQAIRYAVAGLLLAGWARLRHQQLPRPAGREWCWLAVLAAVGLAGCSVLLIMATRAASPAGVGVVIGAAPLIITIAGPVAAGRRPPGRVLAAAGIVTVGAAISQLGSTTGAGWNLPGLLLSAGALAGVAGTSLLAAPLLPRLGALAVTIYACGLAAAQLLAAAVLVRLAGGPPVLRPLTGTELAALLYLAVAVTAVVFVAWFSAVARLGAERTGLFNGLVPIASLIAVAVIGTGTVTGMQLAGALSVLAGVTLGLTQRAGPPADTRRPQRYPPPQPTRPGEPARQPAAPLAKAHEDPDADRPPRCIQRRRLLDRDYVAGAEPAAPHTTGNPALAARAGAMPLQLVCQLRCPRLAPAVHNRCSAGAVAAASSHAPPDAAVRPVLLPLRLNSESFT